MSKRIVLSATERGELVMRLFRKEATAGQLAREAGISEPTLYQWRDVRGSADFKKSLGVAD